MRLVSRLIMVAAFCMISGLLRSQFSLVTSAFPAVYGPDIEFCDYDSDGDLDFIITGSTTSAGQPIAKLYNNEGTSGFTLVTNTPFAGVMRGAVDWGDYDNDGHPDLVLSGWLNAVESITMLYRNLGNGSFVPVNAGFVAVDYSSVEWADYNLDGWLDLLVAGVNSLGDHSKIYRNNRNGTFTDINADLCPVSYGTASWSDFDNDGDPDLLFCGSNHMEVYENLGDDQFQNINAGMTPVFYGAAAWGDFDNDSYPDIVCQGWTASGPITRLYHNNQEGGFVLTPTRLQNCYGGSLTWGDYNSDGKLDLFMTGYYDGTRISKIYRNDSMGIFSPTPDMFPALSSSWATWADYNNDGKLDLFISGYDGSGYHSKLYRNNYSFVNTNPTPPVISFDMESGLFQFSGAGDLTTNESGLTYDIRIGTSPGACNISSPLAQQDGSRKTEKLGRRVIRFIPEPGQTYFASAQTVDRGFKRSAFSNEIVFSLDGDAQISIVGPASLDYGSVYLDHSVVQTLIIANPGTSSLVINQINMDSGINYLLDQIELPLQLAIGATHSLHIRFRPLSSGILADTLEIHSNALDNPILRIPLLGRGVSAPPAAVQNLIVQQDGNDAVLSWDPVNTTTEGDPITPSLYLVLINELPNDNAHFWFLASTPDLSFRHPNVFQFRPSMFYQIVALVLYDDEQRDLIKNLSSSKARMPYPQILEMLQSNQ